MDVSSGGSDASEEERPPLPRRKRVASLSSARAKVLVVPVDGDLARSRSPAPPARPCCPACEQRSEAGDAIVAAVADAAREAVRAAFAELQPALLQALASRPKVTTFDRSETQLRAAVVARTAGRDSGDEVPQRRSSRRKTTTSHKRVSHADVEDVMVLPPPPRLGSRRNTRSKSSVSFKSGNLSDLHAHDDPGPCPRKNSGASIEECLSEGSRASRRSFFSAALSTASRASAARPPTVQTLQTNIAHALLEQHSTYGFAARMQAMHRHVAQEAPAASSSSVVVPEAERLPAASEPKSTTSLPRGSSKVCPTDISESSESALDDNMLALASATRSRNSKRRMSSSQVLAARIQELAQEASHGNGATPYEPTERGDSWESDSSQGIRSQAVPIVLMTFGVLPWSGESQRFYMSMVYQWGIRALIVLSVVVFFLPTLRPTPTSPFDGDIFSGAGQSTGVCWQGRGFLSQTPLPAGAILVLMPFGLRRHQKMLEETFALLHGVSRERRFQEWHVRQARWDGAVFIFIWVSIVSATMLFDYLGCGDDMEQAGSIALHMMLVAIFSGMIMCVAYAMAFMCRSLSIMVDVFCCDVVGQMQLGEVSHVWNLTQAVLRQASVSVEHCLLAFCFVLAFTVPVLVLDAGVLGNQVAPLPALLPGSFLTCGVLYVLLLAAMISEKCARVPSLINAINFGDGTERARQHTVDYITSSGAGFFVFGVRLTTAMVAKFVYIWCIVAVGLLTKFASAGRG